MEEEIKNRLLSRIVKLNNGCWFYSGYKQKKGYGMMSAWGQLQGAHRISFKIFKGKIPIRKFLDHLCRNPSCVNPEHLEVVTNKENVLRGIGVSAINKRKTKCINGHDFTKKNTLITKSGKRQCRKCRHDYQKIYMKNYNKMYYLKNKITRLETKEVEY